jgi:uncharacterized membrane protein
MLLRRLILAGMLALAVAQAAYYVPKMPNPMASHFNGSGVPNGWSSPQHFFGIIMALEVILAGSFLFLTPWSFSRLTDDKINLPNKGYWLAPERRPQTIAKFNQAMLEFGILSQALLIYVVQLSVQANLATEAVLSPNVLVALLIYLGVTVLWLLRLITCFSLPAGTK